jgi:hypothetical protein
MKFDVVTQRVIAYGQQVIYPFAEIALALVELRDELRDVP